MEKIGLVRTRDGKSFLVPFILITSLFFLWGVAHSILDVLNKHFQDTLEITRTRSALIQAVVYGGYFIMALPAGRIIRRFGYRTGVLTGLVLYGIGALLFIPGGRIQSFEFFLLALFVIGCGLTCLETASNPYVTVLGEPEGSERRINLAQSFNGLGWICGPLAGGFFLFAGGGDVTTPYAVLGTVVLCIAILFSRVKLPEIGRETESGQAEASGKSLWRTTSFTVGLLSLFLYVAAQTGINSFFINYATENAGVSAQEASVWLSFGGMGLFMAGRMGGSWLMRFVKGEKVLAVCAAGACVCMAAVILMPGGAGWYFLLLCFLCESIMFPTIFSLSLRHVGTQTKQASSYLIMSIVGGAVAPLLMGLIADRISMAVGFIVPLVCFMEIWGFAARYRNIVMVLSHYRTQATDYPYKCTQTYAETKRYKIVESKKELEALPEGKLLINTINAHSYNTALKDTFFAEALMKGDALIPDGASIVMACRKLKAKSQPTERIAGWDLFTMEMERLNQKGGTCFFMGSSEKVLNLIREKAKTIYPNIRIETYSPPYKPEFSEEENRAIIEAINRANPDLLWIGMTAPKQEKWAYRHWDELDIHCHCGTIGAVFDFFAGTMERAPLWWQEHSLEWLYRLLKEPKRMWRRYIIGNTLFIWNIFREM